MNTKPEKFRPETQEVTEILPTESGEYLEMVRRCTQEHIRIFMTIIAEEEATNDNDGYDEVMNGGHPYRGRHYAPRDPMHPHHEWFQND